MGQMRDRVVPRNGTAEGTLGQHAQANSGQWPRLMRAETAARYVDEKSVETFRRGVGTIWPMPKKVPGKGDRWLRDDLDAAIELITGRQAPIFDAATVLGAR